MSSSHRSVGTSASCPASSASGSPVNTTRKPKCCTTSLRRSRLRLQPTSSATPGVLSSLTTPHQFADQFKQLRFLVRLAEVLVDTDAACPLTVDRKSTRLNSSHVRISYAVFCLKKKKNKRYQ